MNANTSRPIEILLVEDSPSDAERLQESVYSAGQDGFEITHVENLEAGLGCLVQGAFDVLLLDLNLPDSTGVQTYFRARAAAPRVPIILLTDVDDDFVSEYALHGGAQDYFVKGQYDGRQIRRSIRYAVERHRIEQALRASEERFRLASEVASEAIWEWDLIRRRSCRESV